MINDEETNKGEQMTITLEQVFELVSFKQTENGLWEVSDVKGNVYGDVKGSIKGDVHGDIEGDVRRDICGDVAGRVKGTVLGTIRGVKWWRGKE